MPTETIRVIMVREKGGGKEGKEIFLLKYLMYLLVHWSGSLAHESFLSVLLVVEHRAMCMAVQQMSKNFPRHIHCRLFKVFWLCWRHGETERQADRDRQRRIQRKRVREMCDLGQQKLEKILS